MNLNQLFYFSVVGRIGSYSRAADELDVSQPCIYRAIKRLERECGVALLERRGKGVCLTKGGKALYECACQIASVKSTAEETVAAEKGIMSGNVSIGAGTNVASNLLPGILAKWIPAHPHVSVSIVLGQSHQLQEFLLEDKIDLIIGSGLIWRSGLKKQAIFSDTVEVVCCPGHHLEHSGTIPMRELSKERLVVPPRGSGTREELDQIESQYGVSFRVAVEVNRQDVIKSLCGAGVGIALLPRSVINEEIANGQLRLLAVEGFPLSRIYFLVQHAGRMLTPETRSLLAAIDLWLQENRRRQPSYR